MRGGIGGISTPKLGTHSRIDVFLALGVCSGPFTLHPFLSSASTLTQALLTSGERSLELRTDRQQSNDSPRRKF